VDKGFCDAPSFSFGTEFDRPDSQSLIQCTPSVAPYGDDVHVDVGFEGIDPEEHERLCVEAELSRKKPVEQQNIGKNIETPDLTHGKTETPPDNFKTPIRDDGSGVSSIAGSEGSLTGPTQYERRIIKPPPYKKSPFVDTKSEKQYSCSPVVNKLYARVIQHAGRGQDRKIKLIIGLSFFLSPSY
jgi:hypothetical protein